MNSYEAYHLINKTGVSNLKLEKIISKNDYCSYCYAKDILKIRFELGEESISQDCHYSLCYARHILKNRFKLGEKAISQDSFCSRIYAIYVLQGRFRLGEKLMNNDSDLVSYFINLLRYDHE